MDIFEYKGRSTIFKKFRNINHKVNYDASAQKTTFL